MATKHLVDERGRPLAQYDAARRGRRTAGWRAAPTGPNAETRGDLQTLRDRHRDLARNNPWARRAISSIVVNTIGSGIRAQWPTEKEQELWTNWWESTAPDADGTSTGYGLQALILRSAVESGATLIGRRPVDAEFPLKIQVMEPDFIDLSKSSKNRLIQGVQFKSDNSRRGYWLFDNHPGENNSTRLSVFRSANDFAHIYRLDRPGQVHGVPWGVGSMLRLRMLDDYQDAILERQRLAACYMGFRRIPDPLLAKEVDVDYQFMEKFEPGIFEDLPPGWDIEFSSPPQPENDQQFQTTILRAVAADYGIPYEVLTNDLSQVNYSSARMGWSEFERNIDAWRWNMLVPQAMGPIVKWFREAAALVGVKVTEPLWTAPARTMVDASKDLPPIIDAIRAGLMTTPEAIRKQGYDPDVLIKEQSEWLDKLDKAGIVLSSDPRNDKVKTNE